MSVTQLGNPGEPFLLSAAEGGLPVSYYYCQMKKKRRKSWARETIDIHFKKTIHIERVLLAVRTFMLHRRDGQIAWNMLRAGKKYIQVCIKPKVVSP